MKTRKLKIEMKRENLVHGIENVIYANRRIKEPRERIRVVAGILSKM
jgi:hypothetical protein